MNKILKGLKLEEIRENAVVKSVEVKDATIISVSSPETISGIARDNGLVSTEVFVRVVFEKDGDQFKVSNKLGILGKSNYEALLKAKNTGEVKDLVVTETGFFYVNNNVSVTSLFEESKKLSPVSTFFKKK